MFFTQKDNSLIAKQEHETITVEAWGNNALRIRASQNPRFSGEDHALSRSEKSNAEVTVNEYSAEIKNGKISCVISTWGAMEFLRTVYQF